MKFDEETLLQLLENPETIPQLIEGFKPIIYTVASSLWGIYKDLVNNDDYFVTSANYRWKQYDALVSAGFSKKEAMDILLAGIKSTRDSAAKISGTSVKHN